jgi:hypothetical protein
MRPGANQGNVFYIDGNGPDTNDGLTPTTPLASFKAALALCTHDRNDTIVVLDYWAAATEDWPIVVDKRMVHIIAVPQGGVPWAQVNPVGDFAGFNITAAGVEVCNLSVNGGATHGAIEIGASMWGTDIHHCFFGEYGAAQDGIRAAAGVDAAYSRIWACRFGPMLTRNGVRIVNNAFRTMIGVPGLESNWFRNVAAEGIRVDNEFSEGGIFDNRFALVSDTQGYAITLDATCVSGVHVDGNRANFGNPAMVANPYLDGAAADSNNWGLNYWGITATMPA